MRTLYARGVISQKKKNIYYLWLLNAGFRFLDFPENLFSLPPQVLILQIGKKITHCYFSLLERESYGIEATWNCSIKLFGFIALCPCQLQRHHLFMNWDLRLPA
jgi:hypothetical protein